MPKKPKKKAWDACSRYIRLRDSIEYCRRNGLPLDSGCAQCCSCSKVVSHWKYGDAGHFIGRGIGGGSGVYFDERNIHFQCKRCNGFLQGHPLGYREFMLEHYGQKVIDELQIKHHSTINIPFVAIELMYKKMNERAFSSDAFEFEIVPPVSAPTGKEAGKTGIGGTLKGEKWKRKR